MNAQSQGLCTTSICPQRPRSARPPFVFKDRAHEFVLRLFVATFQAHQKGREKGGSLDSSSCAVSCRAWQDMKAFMETTVPAILKLSAHRQLTSSEDALALPATETQGNGLQTHVTGLHSTDQPAIPNEMARIADGTSDALPDRQHSPEPAAVKALLPVVQAVPKHSALQLLALRHASPVNCCSSPQAACIPPAAADLFLTELHSTDLFKVVRHCLSQIPVSFLTPPVAGPQAQEDSVEKPQDAHQSSRPRHVEHERHSRAEDWSVVEDATQNLVDESLASCPISQHETTSSLAATSAGKIGPSHPVPDNGVSHSISHAAAEAAADTIAADSSQNQAPLCACEHQKPSDVAVQGPSCSPVLASEPSLHQDIASSTATEANGGPEWPGPEGSDGLGLSTLGAEVQPAAVAEVVCMVLLLVPRPAWDHSHVEVCISSVSQLCALCLSSHRPFWNSCRKVLMYHCSR